MHDVAVIGGGITGLFAAAAAVRAGLDVVCLEADDAPGLQSRGEGRIFRIAHGEPELCARALRAAELWADCERAAGERFLDRCGLAVLGDGAPARYEAMRAAGAPAELAGLGELRDRVSHVEADPDTPVAWDPSGASIRTVAVTAWLLRLLGDRVRTGSLVTGADRTRAGWSLRVSRRPVRSATGGPGPDATAAHRPAGTVARGPEPGSAVSTRPPGTAAEDVVTARTVVACAGTSTATVAASLGIEVPGGLRARRTLRLTFATAPNGAVPCVIDAVGSYSLPTARGYSVGITGEAVESFVDEEPELEFVARSAAACHSYVQKRLIGVAPPVAEQVCCDFPVGPLIPEDGDGWCVLGDAAARVLVAANAYKFAPLIGEDLIRGSTSSA